MEEFSANNYSTIIKGGRGRVMSNSALVITVVIIAIIASRELPMWPKKHLLAPDQHFLSPSEVGKVATGGTEKAVAALEDKILINRSSANAVTFVTEGSQALINAEIGKAFFSGETEAARESNQRFQSE